MHPLLWLNAAFTFILIGLIWTIQLVHYPLFAKVGKEDFPLYHSAHSTQITILVLPLMLVELFSSIYIVSFLQDSKYHAQCIGLICLGIVWLSTFVLQVPLHKRLTAGFDLSLVRTLVKTNWVRTIAWTTKGFFFLLSLW